MTATSSVTAAGSSTRSTATRRRRSCAGRRGDRSLRPASHAIAPEPRRYPSLEPLDTVGALHGPAAAGLHRCGLATRGDLADHAPLAQDLPARLIVVAGVQVHGGPLGQRAEQPDGVQGGGQQPVVAAVGRGGQRRQRNAARVGEDRPFQPLPAAVHRAGPGDLAAAGRLGDAAVHRQLLQLQAE